MFGKKRKKFLEQNIEELEYAYKSQKARVEVLENTVKLLTFCRETPGSYRVELTTGGLSSLRSDPLYLKVWLPMKRELLIECLPLDNSLGRNMEELEVFSFGIQSRIYVRVSGKECTQYVVISPCEVAGKKTSLKMYNLSEAEFEGVKMATFDRGF